MGPGNQRSLKAVIGVQPSFRANTYNDNPIENNLKKLHMYSKLSVDWFLTNIMIKVQMGLYRQVGLLGRMKSKQVSCYGVLGSSWYG